MRSWIENEFKNSEFVDLRLKDRIFRMAQQLSAGFGQSIPMACRDWAATKGAYRFIDNDRVTEGDILMGHFDAIGTRIAATAILDRVDGHDPEVGPARLHELAKLLTVVEPADKDRQLRVQPVSGRGFVVHPLSADRA